MCGLKGGGCRAEGFDSYLLLVAGFFVCGFHVAFITAHMPAFLSDKGLDAQLGAWSIALIGLCNVVGAFLSGIWSGKVLKRNLLVFIYLMRAVAITLFMLVPISIYSVLTFSAVMGFLWLATVPPYIRSGGCDVRHTLHGPVVWCRILGHQIGSVSGVWLGDWLHDNTGSYDMLWWLGAAFGIFATVVHWPIQEIPIKRVEAKRTEGIST